MAPHLEHETSIKIPRNWVIIWPLAALVATLKSSNWVWRVRLMRGTHTHTLTKGKRQVKAKTGTQVGHTQTQREYMGYSNNWAHRSQSIKAMNHPAWQPDSAPLAWPCSPPLFSLPAFALHLAPANKFNLKWTRLRVDFWPSNNAATPHNSAKSARKVEKCMQAKVNVASKTPTDLQFDPRTPDHTTPVRFSISPLSLSLSLSSNSF